MGFWNILAMSGAMNQAADRTAKKTVQEMGAREAAMNTEGELYIFKYGEFKGVKLVTCPYCKTKVKGIVPEEQKNDPEWYLKCNKCGITYYVRNPDGTTIKKQGIKSADIGKDNVQLTEKTAKQELEEVQAQQEINKIKKEWSEIQIRDLERFQKLYEKFKKDRKKLIEYMQQFVDECEGQYMKTTMKKHLLTYKSCDYEKLKMDEWFDGILRKWNISVDPNAM